MKQNGGRHSKPARRFANLPVQIITDVKLGFRYLTLMTAYVQQSEGSGWLFDITQLFEEVVLVLLNRYTQGLCDEVSNRHGRWQSVRMAFEDEPDFLQDPVERGLLANQVMSQERQKPLSAVRIHGKLGTQQRCLLDIQLVLARVRAPQQFLMRL